MASEPAAPVWLTALAAALVFGGLGAGAYWIHDRRRRGYERIADEYGFEYDPHGSAAIPSHAPVPTSRLFQLEPQTRHVFEGSIERCDISIAQLTMTREAASDGPNVWRMHVYPWLTAYMVLGEQDFPALALSPRKWWQQPDDNLTALGLSELAAAYRLAATEDDANIQQVCGRIQAHMLACRGAVLSLFANEIWYARPSRWWEVGTPGPGRTRRFIEEAAALHERLLAVD